MLNLYIIKENELITSNFDNLISIIHLNEDQECKVVNYHEVCSDSYLPNYKIKLIKLNLRSVEEARRRAAIIALLTYSLMCGPNVFVKLHTKNNLSDSPGFMENTLKLWKYYRISLIDPDNYV